MRYLLTPITMFIWFFVCYSAVYYSMKAILWMFPMEWYWLLLTYSLWIGLISMVVTMIPTLISSLIMIFYKEKWFSVVSHSVAGLLGIVYFYYILYLNPPVTVDGNKTGILKVLWDDSWFKTILLGLSFWGLQLGLIYTGVFGFIQQKIDKGKN